MAETTVRSYVQALPVKRKNHTVPQTEKKVRKPMGNPFKRGRTWTYIYYVKDPVTGKRKQKWRGGFRTKQEASKALALTRVEIAKGIHTEPAKVSYAEYTEHFLEMNRHRIRPNTAEVYRSLVRNTPSQFTDKAIGEITPSDITFIDNVWRDRGLTKGGVATYHRKTRAIFNFAVRQEDLAVSPYRNFKIKNPNQKAKKKELPSPEELMEMLATAKEEGGITYGVVLCGMMLGLRRGEMTGLQFGDFDLEHNVVHIQRQIIEGRNGEGLLVAPLKTDSSDRVIGIPDTVAEYVREQREYASDAFDGDVNDFYLLGEGLHYHRPGHMRSVFVAFLEANDFPAMRLHDLRHAYASLCLGQKVPLKVISDMLGHSTITVTANTYCETTHLKHEAAQALNRLAK